MSKNTKDRLVFSFSNFRGLDTENKQIKVEPFRASYGYNFYSESNTLKTRPAFKLKEDAPFFLETGDYIIDWYFYNNLTIYITKNHIYIQNGDTVFSENNAPLDDGYSTLIKSPNLPSFNFEGKNPIFQEEKECLFIFGLSLTANIGAIFVFSALRDENGDVYRYVLYELSDKPYNPFGPTNDYYETFDNLPSPYEPTLTIGDTVFEDVNFLSKVSKYKLFANVKSTAEGESVYSLPTHFKKDKHTSFVPEITFYNNKFSADMFPVFLGVEGENFFPETDVATDYGTTLNSTAISLLDLFYPKKDFEFEGVPGAITKIVTYQVGLDKNSFFKLRVKGTNGQSVFEYLLNYISLNPDTFGDGMTTNLTMKFEMGIEFNAVYRDETSQDITSNIKEQSLVMVYVQIKKYEINEIFTTNDLVESTSKVLEPSPFTNPWPLYPDVADKDNNFTFEGRVDDPNSGDNSPEDTTPLYKPGYTNSTFQELCEAFLVENKAEVNDGETVKISGRLYDIQNQDIAKSCVLDAYYQNWPSYIEDNVITWNTPSSIRYSEGQEYPSFAPGSRPVIENVGIISTTGQTFNFTYGSTLYNELKFACLSLVDTINGGTYGESGTGWFKVKVQTYWQDYGGTFYEKGVALVIPFTYQRTLTTQYQVRQSFVYTCLIDKDLELVSENLYTFEESEDEGLFKFTLKDYFFDYNNEPSISVKVTFENNPDYDLIANNKFGITFGSENRLFLAGNENYPNIDRFNVSNDLLGDNVVNQSYELSYFPSKNYRVIGGRGAINGYVVATDDCLYVTKSHYPNDNVLFVRTRVMDDNGIVGYNEFKTNAKVSPLNHKCLVRFNNDILILSKDGLVAIELSSNVLTDERLEKPRDAFIHKDLKNAIALCDLEKAFIVEDNQYMYIFLGENMYFLDSRLVAENPNGAQNNVSYEIVKWILNKSFHAGRFLDGELNLLDEEGAVFYQLVEDDRDDVITRYENAVACNIFAEGSHNYFQLAGSFDGIYTDPEKTAIILYNGYKLVASVGLSDYHSPVAGQIVIDNDLAFRDVNDGDTLYFYDDYTEAYYPIVVSQFEENNRKQFFYDEYEAVGENTSIFKDISEQQLYISLIFDMPSSTAIGCRLSPYRHEDIVHVTQDGEETDGDYEDRIEALFDDNEDYYFEVEEMHDCMINRQELVNYKWRSAVTDFGNNLMEKTMFRTNVYATNKSTGNIIQFGYKTMRRLQRVTSIVEGVNVNVISSINLFDFDEVDFNTFALNTFSDFGTSLPCKENNFLYIQFVIWGTGQIELNSFEILYKLNKLLKSFG